MTPEEIKATITDYLVSQGQNLTDLDIEALTEVVRSNPLLMESSAIRRVVWTFIDKNRPK